MYKFLKKLINLILFLPCNKINLSKFKEKKDVCYKYYNY